MRLRLLIIPLLLFSSNLFSQTMHEAIKTADLDKVKSLIVDSPELLTKKYSIETPIHRFIPTEISPLFDAINYGQYEIVKYLISQGIDLKNDNYAIYLALLQKESRIKEVLWTNGARILNDTAPSLRPNILTQAVWVYQDYALVKELIKWGAWVNVDWGEDGNYTHTPLGMATRLTLPKIAKLLIENGAKLNLPRNNGQIGLHDAVFYYNNNNSVFKHGYSTEMLNLLLENGADRYYKDNIGDTPMEFAAIKGVLPALKILWEDNYDRQQINFDGMTLLHRTVIHGYLDCTKFLVSKGFEINTRDNFGNTAIDYAHKYAHPELVDFLIQKGGKSSKTNKLEDAKDVLNSQINIGEAVVWYMGRYGWAIKTQNNLFVKPYDWGELPPESPSLSNGKLNPKELSGLTVYYIGSENKAKKLVSSDKILKSKSKELDLILVSGNKARSSQIESFELKSFSNKYRDVEIKYDNSGSMLIVSEGVKIFFNGYTEIKNEEFKEAVKNVDLCFFNIWGSKGELPEEYIQTAEKRIEMHNPGAMFHASMYSKAYFFSELSKKLNQSVIKTDIPPLKYRGDRYFYKKPQN